VKFALDTNVLAYAAGVDDATRQRRANAIIAAIGAADLVLPSQVAGELYNVLTRKDRHSRQDAVEIVQEWIDLLTLTVHSPMTFATAIRLAADHKLQMWDSIIVCVAAEAGCRFLLSEDFQDGVTYRGVTIANPFAERLHPLLASLLDASPGPNT
jgi:predicted nucleic acid-binding protein